MPIYRVLLTRDCTEHAYLDVEADTPEQAEDIAEDKQYLAQNWTHNVGSADGLAYIADPGHCAELVEPLKKRRYAVTYTRPVDYSVTVQVEAENEDQAGVLAYRLARESTEWEATDCWGGKPELCEVEEVGVFHVEHPKEIESGN